MKENQQLIYHMPFRDRLAGFGLLPKTDQGVQKRIYLVDNQKHFDQPGIHFHKFTSKKIGKEIHLVNVSDNEYYLGEEGSGNREVEFVINRTSAKIEVTNVSQDLENQLQYSYYDRLEDFAIYFAHRNLGQSHNHEKEFIATGSPSQISKQLQEFVSIIRKTYKYL